MSVEVSVHTLIDEPVTAAATEELLGLEDELLEPYPAGGTYDCAAIADPADTTATTASPRSILNKLTNESKKMESTQSLSKAPQWQGK
jgi:hypothetical protein